MDSKLGGVVPKVSLSTSSSFSGSSIPIRAPPTVDDSDCEYSISTNRHENHSSSCSGSRDSGSASDGFESGEDEFETALEGPFFADPDDEDVEESGVVEEHVVSRTFVTDPYGEIKEEGENVHKFAVSRPVVVDTDDEGSIATPLEEEDECFDEPAVVGMGGMGVPKAMVSRDSDDDSVGSEGVDDDGFSGTVRVPGVHLLGRTDSAVKVKGLGVEEGEDDESQFELALEAEVEGCIAVKYSVKDDDSVPPEVIKHEVPDDAEEVAFDSSVASEVELVCETSETKEDGLDSFGEIQVPVNMEQRESENMTEVVVDFQNSETKVIDVCESDHLGRDRNDEKMGSVNEQRGVELHDFVACSCVEPVDSGIVENGVENMDSTAFKYVGNALLPRTSEDRVMEDGLDKDLRFLVSNLDPELELKAEVEGEAGHDSENSEEGSFLDDDFIGLRVGVSDATKLSMDSLEQSMRPSKECDQAKYGEIQFLENMEPQESENITEVVADFHYSETKAVDVCGNETLGRDSKDEKMGSVNEQRVDMGIELHDFVPCSGFEPVDSVIAENGVENTDRAKFSGSYEAQETKYFGNALLPRTSEDRVMEDGLDKDPRFLGSNLDPELELKAEVEGEAGHDSENSEEGSFSEDDFIGLRVGVSDATKLSMDGLEQSSTPIFLGESSQDLVLRTGLLNSMDSDEELATDEESEGKELFDSSVLAALLKAATGAGLGGGNFKVSSANGSRVFSVEHPTNSELMASSGGESEENLSEEEKKKLEKMQMIRVKFLRLVQRLGQSSENSVAAQVLYRLVLSAGRPSSQSFSLELAKRTAMQLEAEGKNDLDFSLNILVLGKTGVGKSATINSIFGEKKAIVNAFEPGTTGVKDIVGTIDGIKVRIFDTPGLRSSLMEQAFNRKILLSIRKLTNRFPPDVVLYVDRLDTQTRDLNDLPLFKSITNLLGSSIWHNSIVTLTHAASSPPDGLFGTPLSYDSFVAQRSRVTQQLISKAVGDPRMASPSLLSPVAVVENHPEDGQRVLPNGESWRPQLLLLCYSMKILSEVNSVAKTRDLFDHRKLFGFRARSPPLPYFLSSLLQSKAHPKLPSEQSGENFDSDYELGDLSGSDLEDEAEAEDEYDQLPPFRPLKKAQVAKLSKEHRKAYFEEYDYRVRLLQKKQLREEVTRLRELKNRDKDGLNKNLKDGNEESANPSAVAVPLPDMALPPSFDGDNPVYRYRFLEPTSQLLTRAVLDSHGWDHDCGYDGVSLESNLAVASRLPAVFAVQITKDRKDFNIHLDSSIAAKHGENVSTMAGLDIQSVGKQLAYILKGETKIKNCKRNKIAAGVSVNFLGENVATGLKIEDQIAVGKRLVLMGSTGAIRSRGDTAYGGNLELRLREKDFPIGQDQTTLSLSLTRWRGELIWSGNLESQLSIGRSSRIVARAGLNSRLSGQVSVRTSSSDQLQIALLGILPIAIAIFRGIFPGISEKHLTQ